MEDLSAAFSILYRIVGSVTLTTPIFSMGGCIFQYPLSDRGLCNALPPTPTGPGVGAFSILYRIVGSVTRRIHDGAVLCHGFQYPLSDRGLCNSGGAITRS